MSKIAIFRERDDDKAKNNAGIYLGDINAGFIKKNKVAYVGTYTYKTEKGDLNVYCLPKYFPIDKCNEQNIAEIRKHLALVCKVIEQLRAEGKSFENDEYRFDPYEIEEVKSKVDRFTLAEYIIDDYLQYGLYTKDLTEIRKNGVGKTSWGKTVSRIQPVIQDGAPVYLDLMNRHHFYDENDLISIIHANVLNQCIEFVGDLISDGVEVVNTEDLGDDLSEYSSLINSRSVFVFKEREINLFKALEAWCASTRYYKAYSGTTAFDRVWEWVNDAVFGNVGSEKESDPPIYSVDDYDYAFHSETSKAKPDTIYVDVEKPRLAVFDSKYYVPKFIKNENGNKVYQYPANVDIAKQVAYLKQIKSIIDDDKKISDRSKDNDDRGQFRYSNAFLFPYSSSAYDVALEDGIDGWCVRIGHVKGSVFRCLDEEIRRRMEIEADNDSEDDSSDDKDNSDKKVDYDKIDVYVVDPEKLYKRYLSGDVVQNDDIGRIVDLFETSVTQGGGTQSL